MTAHLTRSGRSARKQTITDVIVDVVSGLNHPVAFVDVTADFQYSDGQVMTMHATSDSDGRAAFQDIHSQQPNSVCFVVGAEPRECYSASPHMSIALEV